MGTTAIIMLILGLVGTLVGVGTSVATNQSNERSVAETNKANLEAVEKTNAANVTQADLAYKRSLPVNQVADMVASGMSRSAAINKLAGGGTYTAPVMQSGSSMAKQFDFSGIGSAMERLGNIPSNVMQSRLQDQQLRDLQQEYDLRKAAEERAQEKHELDIWQMKYGKELATRRDSFNSYLSTYAADHGIDWNTITNKQELIRSFDLAHNAEWNSLPKSIQDDFANDAILRGRENIAKRSADDQHNLSLLDSALKRSELSERQQSLVYKLALLSQQVELGRLTIDRENYDKAIRDAGFENAKEAAEAFAAADNLRAMYEKDKARRLANSPAIVPILDLMFDKLNPLRELIKVGK